MIDTSSEKTFFHSRFLELCFLSSIFFFFLYIDFNVPSTTPAVDLDGRGFVVSIAFTSFVHVVWFILEKWGTSREYLSRQICCFVNKNISTNIVPHCPRISRDFLRFIICLFRGTNHFGDPPRVPRNIFEAKIKLLHKLFLRRQYRGKLFSVSSCSLFCNSARYESISSLFNVICIILFHRLLPNAMHLFIVSLHRYIICNRYMIRKNSPKGLKSHYYLKIFI